MEKRLYEALDTLGFGRSMKQQIALRIDVAGPHFGASERRKILGHDVKLLALLYHDKKQGKLLIRSYDVVDLTVQLPEHRRPEIKSLDEAMQAINWDAPHFAWQHRLEGIRDENLNRNISSIEEQLKNLAVRDIEYSIEVQRLRLKYMYDSLYGIRNHFDGTSGYHYNQFFSMLSLTRTTGLCPVKDATFLVCQCNINNYQAPEIIQAAVTTRLERRPEHPQRQQRHVIERIDHPLRNAI